MKLITKEIEHAFERQGDISRMRTTEVKIVCKFFNPVGMGTWYIYERQDNDILWEYVNLANADMAECGAISLSELKSLRLPLSMSIERDMYFPILKYTLQEIIDKVQAGEHV